MNEPNEYLDELAHYGTPRHSGRYPWGSGENPYQHESWFLKANARYKAEGMSELERAKAFGFNSTAELRAHISIAKNNTLKENRAYAQRLRDKGYGYTEIGRRMGVPESTVRGYLKPANPDKADSLARTVNILKKELEEKRYLDVGEGIELQLGVSSTTLGTALAVLEKEGYSVYHPFVEQQGTGKWTQMKVLGAPGSSKQDLNDHRGDISVITQKYDPLDDPEKISKLGDLGMLRPSSLDSSRIYIRYAEDGGKDKDGVIELRRGVEDISLGNAKYAQVRIKVDDSGYMKGMAMYSDSIPNGYDVVLNSNKSRGENPFKKLKDDPDNPFGATISPNGQRMYEDANGDLRLSPINKVNEEGDWNTWSKTLASQMLSKQPKELVQKQLKLTLDERKEEYDEIRALTNPSVKRDLLLSFADECDAAAVHLKAAGMPRQASKVILPLTSLSENEIFAPTFEDGETVVLIRYPHAGRFEIPELKVNNRNEEGRKLLFNATDAVGINPKTAVQLSGADFDGDTVLVIPNNNHAIKTQKMLKELNGFDPNVYAFTDEKCLKKGQDVLKRVSDDSSKAVKAMKKRIDSGYSPSKDELISLGRDELTISENYKQKQMGVVSNLITDMQIKGADPSEIARAVKHSMVVIDALKHQLDYKQSYEDNDISSLQKKYQTGGASTLISRAKSEQRVNERGNRVDIDPETGKKIFYPTGSYYVKTKVDPKTGETSSKKIFREQLSTKMAEADDAFKLSSGTHIEDIYAAYANGLKALANTARKEYLSTKTRERDPSAARAYRGEVDSLNVKLEKALMNAPFERRAQLIAGEIVKQKKASADHELTSDELKKIRGQALVTGRARAGAKKETIDISDKEWEAIQAGAISPSKLAAILRNADQDRVRQLATPREATRLPDSKLAVIKSMSSTGYSTKDIANRFGVSASTISKILNGTY